MKNKRKPMQKVKKRIKTHKNDSRRCYSNGPSQQCARQRRAGATSHNRQDIVPASRDFQKVATFNNGASLICFSFRNDTKKHLKTEFYQEKKYTGVSGHPVRSGGFRIKRPTLLRSFSICTSQFIYFLFWRVGGLGAYLFILDNRLWCGWWFLLVALLWFISLSSVSLIVYIFLLVPSIAYFHVCSFFFVSGEHVSSFYISKVTELNYFTCKFFPQKHVILVSIVCKI